MVESQDASVRLPALVIPAYQPDTHFLTEFVGELAKLPFERIYLVDDGSHPGFLPAFHALPFSSRVRLVQHAVNLGKGQALKSGINAYLNDLRSGAIESVGVVTVDADGQHAIPDIVRISETLLARPKDLHIGARSFLQHKVPLRSRVGNLLTRYVFRFMVGSGITDTQSGLRALPNHYLPSVLSLPGSRYDFELEMLIDACNRGVKLSEIPIQTVYLDDNASSHFNPLLDSLRVYFVFARFSFTSFATFLIDTLVFFVSYYVGASLLASTVVARVIAGFFNFFANKFFVFRSRNESIWLEAMKYAFTVVTLGALSYLAVSRLRDSGYSVALAKLGIELLLFGASFSIQRTLVFSRRSETGTRTATDWDGYYSRNSRVASVTRYFTWKRLHDLLRRFLPREPAVVTELGGANSCFYDSIVESFPIAQYVTVDSNKTGMDLFARRYGDRLGKQLVLHQHDILDEAFAQTLWGRGAQSDLCYSVGLIEHFDPPGTAKAIQAHFRAVKDNGIVLLTFPHGTVVYRVIRWCMEKMGLWAFHDERPLGFEEVIRECNRHGTVLEKQVNWFCGLTQGIVVARRSA